MHILSLAAVVTGGLWGGRTERFGAAMLLLFRIAFANPRVMWVIGDVYIDSIIEDTLTALILGRLAFRSDRWWPFAATTAQALTVLVHVFSIVTDISWDAALSARVGLGLLLYASLLAGVAERWLAGETAVSDTVEWRRRRRAP
ncbi:hypothetical protein [Brevundimonas sp.]|uniref:hypothetical protein n=1 Tax=Brevundimonas sp. TaxID=1871086 RepID=UPI002ED932D5